MKEGGGRKSHPLTHPPKVVGTLFVFIFKDVFISQRERENV